MMRRQSSCEKLKMTTKVKKYGRFLLHRASSVTLKMNVNDNDNNELNDSATLLERSDEFDISSTMKIRKRISFSTSKPEAYTCESIIDIKQHRHELWYDDNSIAEECRTEMKKTLIELLTNNCDIDSIDDVQYCLRGFEKYYIENYTEEETIEEHQKYLLQQYRSLKKQQQQKNNNDDNYNNDNDIDEIIREHSLKYSIYSSDRAREFAEQDEIDAMDIHHGTKSKRKPEHCPIVRILEEEESQRSCNSSSVDTDDEETIKSCCSASDYIKNNDHTDAAATTTITAQSQLSCCINNSVDTGTSTITTNTIDDAVVIDTCCQESQKEDAVVNNNTIDRILILSWESFNPSLTPLSFDTPLDDNEVDLYFI